jgi:hypothetical protein
MRLRTEGTPLSSPIRVIKVREVEGSEKMRLKARIFQVIEVATGLGNVALGVPRDSVAIVEERLRAR